MCWRNVKLNTYWKGTGFYSCVYIFLYISIYIYIYIAVINVTSQKRFKGLNNHLWTSPAGLLSSGRTGFKLGQQYFVLTAFLLTDTGKDVVALNSTSYICTSAKLNPFILKDFQNPKYRVFQRDGPNLKYYYLCNHNLPINATLTACTAGGEKVENL